MTDDRTLERAARSWLEAGPVQAPTQPVDEALARIASMPQERALRWPWRPFSVPFRLVAVVSAAALVVAVTVSMVHSGLVGPFPVTTEAPSPAASLGPSPTARPLPTAVTCSKPAIPQGAVTSGCLEVPQTWEADLEGSTIASDGQADLWLDAGDGLYLAALGASRIRVQTETGPAACRVALSREPAAPVERGTTLKGGPLRDQIAVPATSPELRLCVESRDGQLFEVHVLGYGKQQVIDGGQFNVVVISWIRWAS